MTQPFDNRDWDTARIAELEDENEHLKVLCARAADALAAVYHEWPIIDQADDELLIAELRDASRLK